MKLMRQSLCSAGAPGKGKYWDRSAPSAARPISSFVPVAIAAHYFAQFGLVGRIVGWFAMVLFGVFLAQSLFGFVLHAAVTVVRRGLWRVVQVAIELLNTAVYAALCLIIWRGLVR
jgi:hypothetical protein